MTESKIYETQNDWPQYGNFQANLSLWLQGVYLATPPQALHYLPKGRNFTIEITVDYYLNKRRILNKHRRKIHCGSYVMTQFSTFFGHFFEDKYKEPRNKFQGLRYLRIYGTFILGYFRSVTYVLDKTWIMHL